MEKNSQAKIFDVQKCNQEREKESKSTREMSFISFCVKVMRK